MEAAALTREQMARVDGAAVAHYGITLSMMMENAGRAVPAALMRHEDLADLRVLVAAGPGNNGGGGLAAVRHLVTAGARVEVVLAQPLVQMVELPREYAEVARGLDVPFWRADRNRMRRAVQDADWVVDALLGYNQHGPLQGVVKRVATAIGADSANVLALDLPTGLDPDTGKTVEATVAATTTVTLGALKAGLVQRKAKKWCGSVWIATLGLPEAVFRSVEVEGALPVFESDGLVFWE